MADRRAFLAGLLATGLVPKASWADAGSPAFLSAGKRLDGAFVLCGLNVHGALTFALPLPARGHAAAAHPSLPEAVAFARRPGTYAIVLDCARGRQKAQLIAPEGRHFYGHGVFASAGDLLFTTENDYGAARGVIGVWDVRDSYKRIGEFWSGGTGPHDLKLLPDGKSLVVANGGIETHPDTGRTKLNLPSMRSNLSYLSLDGVCTDQMTLSAEHQRNSIRHLAVSGTGEVAFAMQWQGDLAVDLPLLGLHRRGAARPQLFAKASVRSLQGYLGSIAFNDRTQEIAVTSPRSGLFQVYSGDQLARSQNVSDVCGVAMHRDGFLMTNGRGRVLAPTFGEIAYDIAWDNHLIALRGANL